MAVIRVDDNGKRRVNKHTKRTVLVASFMAIVGVIIYATGDSTGGIFMILGGNTLATIYNLADDS